MIVLFVPKMAVSFEKRQDIKDLRFGGPRQPPKSGRALLQADRLPGTARNRTKRTTTPSSGGCCDQTRCRGRSLRINFEVIPQQRLISMNLLK